AWSAETCGVVLGRWNPDIWFVLSMNWEEDGMLWDSGGKYLPEVKP
ncbi:uncharacterized, partial [Tachysurus ichikawai]